VQNPITVNRREYGVVIVRCLEQGQSSAQQIAHDLIEELDPRWLLLVGIAGGVPAEEYTLGRRDAGQPPS
jgi:nucleoside phosphorylase